MKIKWKIEPKPTGKYASFEHRGWPSAVDEKERPIAYILSTIGEDYYPSLVKTGSNAPLFVRVAIYSISINSFEWKRLKGTFETLQQAKDAFKNFAETHPDYFINKKA